MKKMAFRLAVYSIVLLYLFLDLFVFEGPFKQKMKPDPVKREMLLNEERSGGVIARVYYEPIYRTQLDRAMQERMWREGRTIEALSSTERELLEKATLNELITDHLFRKKVHFNNEKVPVTEEEIDKEVARFASQFLGKEQLLETVRAQGWDENELRMRMKAGLQREAYLNQRITIEPHSPLPELPESLLNEHSREYLVEAHLFPRSEYTKEVAEPELKQWQASLSQGVKEVTELIEAHPKVEKVKKWIFESDLPVGWNHTNLQKNHWHQAETKHGYWLLRLIDQRSQSPEERSLAFKEEWKQAHENQNRLQGISAYLQVLRRIDKERVAR